MNKPLKYYTAFLYKNYTPKELHCTHVYYGKLNESKLATIVNYLDDYFDTNNVKVPIVNFNVKDLFGPNKDIKVLKPATSVKLLRVLRNHISLGTDSVKYPYNPHVTTGMDQVYAAFSHYAIVTNTGGIVKQWELGVSV